MIKVLLLSAHFDDAVLSAGQFMAGRPDCDVVTVFGGWPKNDDVQTEYDKKCGFDNAKNAVAVRRDEDDRATALLQANPIHFEFPDSQYGQKINPNRIKKAILEQIEKEDYEFIVAPLGLDHPDHVLVSNCVVELKDDEEIKIPVYLWEDLPTRVVYPEQVFARVNQLSLTELASIGTGPIADKVRALWCYGSQMRTGILDPYVMYVPERFWKV